MNVRLSKTLTWYSAVVYQDEFFVNHYDLDLKMMTVSSDHDEQNVAYERLKYWINNILNSAVLISHDNPRLELWQHTGARIMVLPEEPVDQIVGMMLYLKLNAIMENRLVVISTEVRSSVGDDMGYTHHHGENLGALSVDGWWSDPRLIWSENRPKEQDKVVSLDRLPEWKDYRLDWNDEKFSSSNTVVFADFTRNED